MGLIAEEVDDACGYLLYHFGFNANVRRGTPRHFRSLRSLPNGAVTKSGTRLWSAPAQIALKRGCSQMDWTVWNMNPPAIAFYLALGAKSVDDEIVMGLKIGEVSHFTSPFNAISMPTARA